MPNSTLGLGGTPAPEEEKKSHGLAIAGGVIVVAAALAMYFAGFLPFL